VAVAAAHAAARQEHLERLQPEHQAQQARREEARPGQEHREQRRQEEHRT
jgi:hypothetical protein